MESQLICSSSFLLGHPSLFHVPYSSNIININVKRPRQKPYMTTAKLGFTTFLHPIKKLFHKQDAAKTSAQVLINNNVSSSSKQLAEKNKLSLLVDNFLNTFDYFISTSLDLPLHSGNDPEIILSGNFGPVGEYPPTPCPIVEGSLPSCLDGAYIRNGPNPRFLPKGPYHYLDGDGMLHVLNISKGNATYCSRFVKTHKYEMESRVGYSVVPSFIACFDGLAASAARSLLIAARVHIARQFDPSRHGFGVANTTVVRLAGRLFAMVESDLPYEIKVTRDGDIVTLGRHDFHSTEPSFVRMSAHPKVDLETGDAFSYRYDTTRPFLTFHRIDSRGRKQKDVPIFSKRECTVVHDFGITENYAIFPDSQVVINPMFIFRGSDSSAVRVDPGKVPRVGIIPKYAEDEGEMRWIDAPGVNLAHIVNAWEEDDGDTIVMVVTNSLKVENIVKKTECSRFTLEKVTIDVKAKSVKRRPLSAAGRSHEFGTINPAYANRKNRYAYGVVLEGRGLTGVEKLDLSLSEEGGGSGDCMVARRMYASGCNGGEAFFVPREPNNPGAEEDDGYLITYVHDLNVQQSKFLVMDAKSPNLDIIAAVNLPQRVPFGFHGLFVSESDLNKL